MSEANKALARRFYESINAGRLEIIDEVVAENFVEHENFPGLEPNREGLRQMFGMMRKAFPDFRMTIEDMVAEGDRVFIRALMAGTHKGEFLGWLRRASGSRSRLPISFALRPAVSSSTGG